MPYRLAALFAVLATTSAFASLVWTHSSLDVRPNTTSEASIGPEASPIEATDQAVRKRFHTLTKVGISRIPQVHTAVNSFSPETALEQAAVANLKKQRWEVSLYLVGREALESEASEADWDIEDWQNQREITGPLFITEELNPKDRPSGWELREYGRKALINADSGDSFVTTSGRWKIEARAVRADRHACLKCHSSEGASFEPSSGEASGRPLRVGDALGVVLYLYARNPK